MNKIKAVIFDMDGVLVDAKEWHYEALNQALAHFGHTIEKHEHLKIFDGLPTRKKLQILSTDWGFPLGLHELVNSLKQLYTIDIANLRCKPTFQHEYALSRLKATGYRIAVCSNSVRNSVETMMKRTCLDPYLEFIISNEDVTHAKPDPEMYTKAIGQLSLRPEQCVIVEDNENGIRAAKASGAHVMIVNTVDDVNFSRIFDFISNI